MSREDIPPNSNELELFELEKGKKSLIRLLQENKLTISLSEGRRLVCMGAVKVNGELCEDLNRDVEVGDLIEVGKKKKIVVE